LFAAKIGEAEDQAQPARSHRFKADFNNNASLSQTLVYQFWDKERGIGKKQDLRKTIPPRIKKH